MPRTPPRPYEQKFASLLRLIAEVKAQGADSVLISNPEALGDDYTELVESLNRLAQAELAVRILPPSARAKP